MSSGSDKQQHSNNCVCATLQAIADAQDKIEDDHFAGCRRSIEELKGRIKPKGFDTIPVLLQTIGGTPFSAVGAERSASNERLFNVFKSFLFRVHDVGASTGSGPGPKSSSSSNSCCATLELLDPVSFRFDESSKFSPSKNDSCSPNLSPDFDEDSNSEFNLFLAKLEDSKKIVRTGIFVTVDLNDFTSVACLPAVITC